MTGKLGDYKISLYKFEDVDLNRFKTKEFSELNAYDKHDAVCNDLIDHILKSPQDAFLLGAVVHYISSICKEQIIERFNFQSFELWLNQFSGRTPDENASIRARIMGKNIPRECYQSFFPIGMGKVFEGTHFVAAHASPDLDTTVASFWGWVDAFAARVGTGLHIWNVPGGSPAAQVEIDLLFRQHFGNDVFSALAKTGLSLTLSSYDLMTQKGVMKKELEEPALSIDHERNQNAIVLIDNQGYYIGDWRNMDVEGVRQVIMLLSTCLNWYESNLHIRLIALFAKPDLNKSEVPSFMKEVLLRKIKECDPAKEFTVRQQEYLQDYLQKVLGVEKGIEATFQEIAQALEKNKIADFASLVGTIRSSLESDLFGNDGTILENRPLIFEHLTKIVTKIEETMRQVSTYVEKLAVAFQIKTDVFGFKPSYLSHRADIEEIKLKMSNYPYLTVNYYDDEGRHVPVGIIRASALNKTTLGTVTLRDFSNREETNIPDYLDVISVIDHHKTTLRTLAPPMCLICDAQSSNALVAELTFGINDRFSTGGMSLEQINAQIKPDTTSSQDLRIQRRLLQRKMVALSLRDHYISKTREMLEYTHFLYAILDDTDLLTKVSDRDIHVVAQLLNRLKSLSLSEEVEVIHFDDIPHGPAFTQQCAARLLQNEELYSLYSKVYVAREKHVDAEIAALAKGQSSILFEDTKIQNSCARVGQMKIFAKNYGTLSKHIQSLRSIWLTNAQAVYKEHKDIALHIQMVSTISSAEELYKGSSRDYNHLDEMWIWVPDTELGLAYLKSFLNAFRSSPSASHMKEVEFFGSNHKELAQSFKESFIQIPTKTTSKDMPIAVIRYTAGKINSRKAMITPYLPTNK
ncbi:MAG: hypothetical protein KDK50_03265 [Chlamydiia bacterium]|nr:hypothetical protein [Chlamydiia bacterium]